MLVKQKPNHTVYSPVEREPTEGHKRFRNHQKLSETHPFVIYYDFKTAMQKIRTTQPDDTKFYHNLRNYDPDSLCEYNKCGKVETCSKPGS